MRLKKVISGIAISLFLANFAIADSSTSYTIDMSTLNSGGDLTNSTNYILNDTIAGFVDSNFGYSTNYTLGSGLAYLELLCGNGILEFGEKCDDGNTTSGDGCDNVCQIEGAGPVCGNGVIEFGEGCDDGNTVSGDGCSATCTVELAICGNGLVEPGEQCDDGNMVNGDGCSTGCQFDTAPSGGGGVRFAICGNGVREGTELCDDGNHINGDGCNSVCISEKVEAKPAAPEVGERTIKIKARPEKRVNPTQNWATTARIWFYDTTQKKTVLTTTVEINNAGWGLMTTKNLPEGTYNISLKGLSHLTKVVKNITIDKDAHTLDFTNGNTSYLLAGDVHGTKDNFVNGLDISATVRELYSTNIHADLNKDNMVNGLDISIVVGNLYRYGERIDA